MPSKTNLEMMEMFNLILKEGLTPNQFYMLYALRESVSTLVINQHAELRGLLAGGWVKDHTSGAGINIGLQPKAVSLLQQVESYFHVQKKKTDKQIMGDDFQEKIQEYLEIFPMMKLPSGKNARVHAKNIEPNMKWFFQTFDYSWDIVLRATKRYVAEYELRRYMYMQTSQYFIRKQNTDKTSNSELANYCNLIASGKLEEEVKNFSEKVV